jgi:hypothetical protein
MSSPQPDVIAGRIAHLAWQREQMAEIAQAVELVRKLTEEVTRRRGFCQVDTASIG